MLTLQKLVLISLGYKICNESSQIRQQNVEEFQYDISKETTSLMWLNLPLFVLTK